MSRNPRRVSRVYTIIRALVVIITCRPYPLLRLTHSNSSIPS